MSKDVENAGTETAGEIGGGEDVQVAKRVRQEQLARKAAKRDLRLKAQLRSNLQRRKAQTRARREGEADDRPGDLATDPAQNDPARNGPVQG